MPYYRCHSCGLTTYSAASYSSARACPACLEALPDDARLHIVPGDNADVSLTLLARPAAAAEARHALVGFALPQITREDLALVVTELVTNSVRHAGLTPGAQIGVESSSGPDSVSLAVHDGGAGFRVPRRRFRNAQSAGGRGLLIVDALSEAWGVDCAADGCTVWCRIAIDERPAPALAGYAPSGDIAQNGAL
jgi:anti-sigma regulatory factor (Ser/Thr protein kinase)